MKIQFHLKITLFLIVILLTIFAVPVFAQSGGGPGQAPAATVPDAVLLIIPLLVGGVAVPLINFVKEKLNWTAPEDKQKNIWLSFGVSIGISVLALFITSSFLPMNGDPAVIVGWITLAFTTSTMVYKNIQDSPQPSQP